MLSHLDGFQSSLRALQGLAESTVYAYSSQVEELHAWLVSKKYSTNPKALETKGQRYIEEFLEYCFYRKNANVTRRTKLTGISKFIRYLVYIGVISSDFTSHIPRPRVRRKFMIIFTHDEVLRMFGQLDITKEKHIRDACILILAVFCGLRMNEIITLDLDAISDGGKDLNILIKGKQYAGNISRSVDLWKIPAHIIQQYFIIRLGHGARSNDPFLVSYRRGSSPPLRLTQAAVAKMIKKLAADAGLRKPEIHLHMFRATHANDCRRIKGYDIYLIMKRMGWEDMSTAGRYMVMLARDEIGKFKSWHEYWLDVGKIWTKAIVHDDKKQIEYKGETHEFSIIGGDDGKE